MTYWYLATPYSKFPSGQKAAYRAACEQQALLIRAGIPVFCPIAHTHGPAVHGNISLTDHSVWLPADAPFMAGAFGIIVCKLPSWEISYGIQEEIKVFDGDGKPVVFMEPGVVPLLPDIRKDSPCLPAARLTDDSAARKSIPLATGCFDYFPDALAAVAHLSFVATQQHHPGEPMHWDREKSPDHADCILRHMKDRGTLDKDGELHDTKVAWRALAQAQIAIEKRIREDLV